MGETIPLTERNQVSWPVGRKQQEWPKVMLRKNPWEPETTVQKKGRLSYLSVLGRVYSWTD